MEIKNEKIKDVEYSIKSKEDIPIFWKPQNNILNL